MKTRGILIEKLRREQSMALARVQDLAGARIVIEGGWLEQDEVVAELTRHFDRLSERPSRITDRRMSPSHGYRAVHVIVFPQNVPVEIQVRTEMQNHWAQIVERLADRWGRGIRYGDNPIAPDTPAEGVVGTDGSSITRQRIIDDLRGVSDQIAEIEQMESELASMRNATTAPLEHRIAVEFGRESEDIDTDARRLYRRLRGPFKQLVVSLQRLGRRPFDRRRAGRIVRRTLPDVTPPDVEYVRTRLAVFDSFAGDATNELASRLKTQQATLRDMLHGLVTFVEQGGIR